MQFIFVSANIDAVRTGTSIGIREDLCKQYNVGDERAMYCCMSMMVSDYRSADSAKNGRRHGANSPNGGGWKIEHLAHRSLASISAFCNKSFNM